MKLINPLLVICLFVFTQLANAEPNRLLTGVPGLLAHQCLSAKVQSRLDDNLVIFDNRFDLMDQSESPLTSFHPSLTNRHCDDLSQFDLSPIGLSRVDLSLLAQDRLNWKQPQPFYGTAGLFYDVETGELFIDVEDPEYDSFVGFDLKRSSPLFDGEEFQRLVPDVQLFHARYGHVAQGTIGAKIPNGLYTIGAVLPVGLSEAEFMEGFTNAVFGSGNLDAHDLDLHYSRPLGAPKNSRAVGTTAFAATPEPSALGMFGSAAFACLAFVRKRIVRA